MGPDDLLYALIDFFDRIGVPYFVTGSIAAMAYGEPRFTNDVDIVADLHPRDVDALMAAFPPPDFYLSRPAVLEAIRTRHQFNLLHITEGVKADIILPQQSEYDQLRFARREPVPVGSRGEAILASPENVILKKLEYYREGGSEKHLRDIVGILKTCTRRVARSSVCTVLVH